jgi:hypothetical protein
MKLRAVGEDICVRAGLRDFVARRWEMVITFAAQRLARGVARALERRYHTRRRPGVSMAGPAEPTEMGNRRTKSMFQIGVCSNRWIWVGVGSTVEFQLWFTYAPFMTDSSIVFRWDGTPGGEFYRLLRWPVRLSGWRSGSSENRRAVRASGWSGRGSRNELRGPE